LDLDSAVAAGCLRELAYRPAGLALDPAADRKRREDDGEMGFDLEQPVVGADDDGT